MKKEVLISIALLSISILKVSAEDIVSDSLKQVNLNDITILANRVGLNAPIAHSNLNSAQIKQSNTAKNIPLILQTLPSVVSFSEDGSGIGNSSMRIRGTDATRINVTLNGMPMNNPESQEVYWVNLPDISSFLQDIQVQRGVGSSTNGTAAFGASVSLRTAGAKPKAYAEVSTAGGSYNTLSSSIAFGTGLLNSGLSLNGRYSFISGNGYIRNGKVNHKSLYSALSYYKNNQFLRLMYINGIQHTGITWEGISPEQMVKDRRYNSAGEYVDEKGNIQYYNNETDNYYSNIVQLTYSNELIKNTLFNIGLSYNNGYGYYENYKTDQSFHKFALMPQSIDGIDYKSSDVIRRKTMKNQFYVANSTISYQHNQVNTTMGASLSVFDGDHYGTLNWIKYNQDIPLGYEWYRNSAQKTDWSIFTKLSYVISPTLSLFGDMQYRSVNYKMNGIDDDLENITNKNQFYFLNPKLGINYSIDKHEVYGLLAVANREPLRTDLKESVKGGGIEQIKSERMYDYELGYRYINNSISLNANLYYMYYKNQMVQTGKLNDVGYKFLENVPSSYRMGVELVGGYQFTDWMRLDANVTLSRNKIKDYTAYYNVYDSNWNFINQNSQYMGETDLSFSPNIVSSSILSFTPSKVNISLIGKYVGKQYYDNTSNDKNRLADYFIVNFVAGYTFALRKIEKIDFQFFINNALNKHYVGNAWISTDKLENGQDIIYKGLFPQATRNIMCKLVIQF